MITLLLLPFLLVSRVSDDVDTWFYGPEYTYRAHISVATKNEESSAISRALDISSILKCRPHALDTLNCRYDTTRADFFEEGLVQLGEQAADFWEMDEEPFEIKFDRRGIKSLVVTRSMRPWAINVIRSIVGQLNVGMELRNAPYMTISQIERSYLGECEATVVAWNKLSIENEEWREDGFEIAPMKGTHLQMDSEDLVIEKRKQLYKCEDKVVPYYASSRNPVDAEIQYSLSSISISSSNYTGKTENVFWVHNGHKNTNVTLLETIRLSLDSVAPAKAELPAIPSPKVVSFVVQTHEENDNPLEDCDSDPCESKQEDPSTEENIRISKKIAGFFQGGFQPIES